MVPKQFQPSLVAALALAVVLSGCAAPLATGDFSAKEIGEQAQEKYESIDSYEATITSSIRSGNTTRTTTARVWIRPHSNEMRYEYVSPEPMNGTTMVSNGSVMWLYNETTNTAHRTDISGFGAETTAVNYSRVFEDTFENYDVAYDGSSTVGDRSVHVVELTPKENGTTDGIIEEYRLWVDTERWFPVKTEMTMTVGNETITSISEYENLVFNTDVSDDVFEFEPPADATVEENDVPDIEQHESVADANAAASFDVVEPNDLPDGYEFRRATLTNASEYESVSLTYENESDVLSVSQSTMTASNVDGDGTVTVNDREATVQSFGDTTTVSWTCDEWRYTVTGTLSTDALTDVAASIDCE